MTTTTQRSFVLEPTKLCLDSAEDFGDLVHVFGKKDRRPSIWTDDFVTFTINRMQEMNYDPSIDAIVVAGSIVSLVRIIGTLCSTFTTIRVLLYDSTQRTYVLREVGPCDQTT